MSEVQDRKVIYKVANNSFMLVFEDMTNKFWEIAPDGSDKELKYNNINVKFIQYDKDSKKTKQFLPVYVDADELMAVMSQIRAGNFFKALNPYKSYGGSKGKGLAKKLQGNDLVPILNTTEARELNIYVNDKKLYVQGAAYPGVTTERGGFTKKKDSKPVARLFYGFDTLNAYIMAETICSYLQARKTLALSTYDRAVIK